MTYVETEFIQDGEPVASIWPRTDLRFEVDAAGRVLSVSRVNDQVRSRDYEDVVRALCWFGDEKNAEAPEVSPGDLAAIRARADAATPGPWHADPYQCTVNTGDGRALVNIADVLLGEDDTREHHPQASADAAFIAAAREDVPALLAEVAQLRRVLMEIVDYADNVTADPRREMLTWHAVTAIGNTARQAVGQ